MWCLLGGSAPVALVQIWQQNRQVLVFAKAVETGGPLVVQRFNSGDRKLGVPFVGLSGESEILVC